MNECGIVVIGRNEGERLTECLQSLAGGKYPGVYVDSGSTDGSVENAKRLGACVTELDLSIPFTAARARNVGFEQLLSRFPDTKWVQFVDGDCVVAPEWLERGIEFLNANGQYAIVCGMLSERFPDASIYNRLMATEWDRHPGDINECGGIFMVRADAFRKAGGFDPAVIAGEEPELCVRLRTDSWKLRRLPFPMALHDAGLTRFSQWWKRCVRSGYGGYAIYLRCRDAKPRPFQKSIRSATMDNVLASCISPGDDYCILLHRGNWGNCRVLDGDCNFPDPASPSHMEPHEKRN